MSQSHKNILPVLHHALTQRFETELAAIEPRTPGMVGRSEEIPDILMQVTRNWMNIWPEGVVKYNGFLDGMYVLADFKDSVSDLNAHWTKPWYSGKHDKPTMAHWRFIALHKAGPVRPEHVEERYGWGVIEFDERGIDIVRPSHLHTSAFHTGRRLTQALLADQAQRLAQNMATFANRDFNRPPVQLAPARPSVQSVPIEDGENAVAHAQRVAAMRRSVDKPRHEKPVHVAARAALLAGR